MAFDDKITFTQEIKVRKDTDVFIAGGGPAGIAAAVAASRSGASVYLIESTGCFGGLGTAGLVPCYMQFGDGVNFLADGIGREVYENLRKKMDKDQTAADNAIHPEALKRVYDEMMCKAGVDFRFFSNVIGVLRKGDAVDAAVVSSKSGIYAIRAKVFIDCTGDGDLCVQAGAHSELGDENGDTMPSTLASFWTNIDWANFSSSDQAGHLEEAFQNKMFTVEDRHLTGLSHAGTTYGGGNIGHAFDVNGTDEASLTHAMVEQRERLMEFEKYYRTYVRGCEKAEIIQTAQILGVRESRRITCDYRMTIDDWVARAVFDDEIGRYCYPVDIHPKTGDKKAMAAFKQEHNQTYRYNPGESYGISYRALTVKGISNLLVAGRCICSDQKFQASVRTMPGCYITGQGAGVAAALAAQNGGNTRNIDIIALHNNLKKLGAYLPNAK